MAYEEEIKEMEKIFRELKGAGPEETLILVKNLKPKLAQLIIIHGAKGMEAAADLFRQFGREADFDKFRPVFEAWMADAVINGYGHNPRVKRALKMFEAAIIYPAYFGPIVDYEYLRR